MSFILSRSAVIHRGKHDRSRGIQFHHECIEDSASRSRIGKVGVEEIRGGGVAGQVRGSLRIDLDVDSEIAVCSNAAIIRGINEFGIDYQRQVGIVLANLKSNLFSTQQYELAVHDLFYAMPILIHPWSLMPD